MATIIYPSPIFGPVHSRRLGISLGINLLPEDGKWCSFDCIYCECGFNADHRPHAPLPTLEEVSRALEAKLRQMEQEGRLPDVLTFAGNGEPTMNPQFPEIVDETIRLRDAYCPQAKVSVLSNATQIHRPAVREALMKVDNNILKLDTVDAAYIGEVDRPQGRYDVERIVEGMAAFKGQCIIQTMLMRGTYNGRDVDNTLPAYVAPYLEALKRIAPRMVMLYTIDRETPAKGLLKASPESMNQIADAIRAMGIEVSVSC